MAGAATYCTHRDVEDVFPNINDYDSKEAIYGWSVGLENWYDTVLDVWSVHNTGLITQLFWDGSKVDKIAYNTTETTKLDGALTPSASVFYVDASHGLEQDDIVKINNEYIRIVSVSSDTITVSTPGTNRGLFNTNAQHHANDSSVYLIIDASVDVGEAASGGEAALSFVYDADLDMCLLVNNSTDPSDHLVEAGEDFATLMTRVMANASRFFDSRVDSTISRDQWKDREGNYDYMIVRTVALITTSFMIKSHDPMNIMLGKFEEEVDINIALINGGQAKLSHQNTADSAKGSIREVGTISGAIRPVDTRGSWGGTYDLIKVKIILGGALGTATYSVWVKDGDKLGVNEGTQVVTAEKINGDYQALAGGLQIRFAGSAKDSTATINDEWEVEVWGRGEAVDNPVVRSVKMTRGWKTTRLGY